MGPQPYIKKRPYKKYYSGKGKKFIPSSGWTPQNRAMQFVPRALGNPLSYSERKYFDSQLVTSPLGVVTATFNNAMKDPVTLNTLFCPIPGTGISDRIGRRVTVRSIRIRGTISFPAALGSSTPAVDPVEIRQLVCLDRQTNGTQMNSQSLIDSGAGSLAIEMFQSTANFGRFRVLKDKRYILQDPNASASISTFDRNGLMCKFDYTFKFRKGIQVHFNATAGGTVADIVDNSFHLLCAVSTITNGTVLSYKVRTCFVDF